MDLTAAIEFISAHEKELVVFNPRASIADELAAYFESQNVRIRTERTASAAPRVAVLGAGRDVLAITEIAELRRLVDSVPTAGGAGIADAAYEDLLRYLKETTFTSCDTEKLLYASREIEDRARRVGKGTIHAGFQRVSVMAGQRAVYRDLARRGIEVHAYGLPDAELPDLGPARIHATAADEIERTWFVVFDGGGDDSQKSALIARRDEDGWFGAWTYDAAIVGELCDHLARSYRDPTDGTRLSE